MQEKKKLANIKNIIVIASGKGGVGKSSVALNLAYLLAQRKFKVGLLDADMYGPSIPSMLKLNKKIEMNKDEKFLPDEKYNMKIISIGSLVNQDTPILWRGPMITKMLNNFILKTQWGELDYLIIDTPPGTGDIHISLITTFIIDYCIFITTSQKIAMADVERAFYMFKKLEVKILGVIENMSFEINENGENYLFGKQENTINFVKKLDTKLITKIPFMKQISESADNGVPPVVDIKIAKFYEKAAEKIINFSN